MLKLALGILAYLEVANAQTCDCDAYARCITKSKQAKEKCHDTCMARLDPVIISAMDKCAPQHDKSKMECMVRNTCKTETTTRPPIVARPAGKDHDKGKRGGKSSFLTQFLTEEQRQSITAFQNCLDTICQQQDGDDCRTQYPNCAFDQGKADAARTTCGVVLGRPEPTKHCKCFLTALSADSSICDNFGRFGDGGKGRRRRSAESIDDLF